MMVKEDISTIVKELASKITDVKEMIPPFMEGKDISEKSMDHILEPVSKKDSSGLTKFQIGLMRDEYGLSDDEIGAFENWEGFELSLKSNESQEDSNLENIEKTEKKGGRYSEVKKNSSHPTHEVHHMPADSAYDILNRDDGPAIKMETEDHKRTASYGGSKDAIMYRQKQRELIEQGKFMEALKMDIEDIVDKFGDKYNEEIKQLLDYVKELIEDGTIQDEDNILDELYALIGEDTKND